MAAKLRTEALESTQVSALAERIGAGDLSVVPQASALVHHPLLARMSDMRASLVHALSGVSEVSRKLADTTGQMTRNARAVDGAMAQQSTSTSAIAATIQELTVSIDRLSGNAAKAARLAQEGNASADAGAAVVRSAIAEMQSIAASIGSLSSEMDRLGGQFDSVTSVIGLIKDIADQTNLLALNAAIEAARAGEQGRGFAVVADEVRKLAERTRQATDDIGRTIADIQVSKAAALQSIGTAVQKAGAGAELAGGAIRSIDTISAGVTQLSGVVSEISSALREQTSAASDIAVNIERVTAMAQDSSRAANAVCGDSDVLTGMANDLAATVSRFRLA
jgi:methyl-accepting chemotaxis protein